jgi:hypothetical protein
MRGGESADVAWLRGNMWHFTIIHHPHLVGTFLAIREYLLHNIGQFVSITTISDILSNCLRPVLVIEDFRCPTYFIHVLRHLRWMFSDRWKLLSRVRFVNTFCRASQKSLQGTLFFTRGRFFSYNEKYLTWIKINDRVGRGELHLRRTKHANQSTLVSHFVRLAHCQARLEMKTIKPRALPNWGYWRHRLRANSSIIKAALTSAPRPIISLYYPRGGSSTTYACFLG